MISQYSEDVINSPNNNEHLIQIPPKIGRYVVLDTETTGCGRKDHIIELCVHEIVDGKITGNIYYKLSTSRKNKNNKLPKFKIYKEINGHEPDKDKLIGFLKFIGDFLIFAHNSLFDSRFINRELFFGDSRQFLK